MATLTPLVALDALAPCQGQRVCKNGLDLAVFRIGDAVYAIDDSCPHAGASLSSGRVQGSTVSCKAHGLRFDLRHSGGPDTLPLKKYPLIVVDGMVMLEHPATDATTNKELT